VTVTGTGTVIIIESLSPGPGRVIIVRVTVAAMADLYKRKIIARFLARGVLLGHGCSSEIRQLGGARRA
jgi:hypothetical protein